MSHQPMPAAEQSIDRLFAQGTLTGLPDRDLLRRFAALRDELAFKTLVARHGSMVWSVCHSVLRDSEDAEDAMQATLLVLARKAHSIRSAETLSGWLCRVAFRISVRAGILRSRRRQSEGRALRKMATSTERLPSGQINSDEVAALLEELDRLPDRYRLPVVLCHLEGLTSEAAAAPGLSGGNSLGPPVSGEGTASTAPARSRRLALAGTPRGRIALEAGSRRDLRPDA